MTELEMLKPNGDALLPLDKCCDMNEILFVSAINRDKAMKEAERKARSKGRSRR